MKARQPSELEKLSSRDPRKKSHMDTYAVTDDNRLAQTPYIMSQFFKDPLLLAKLANFLAQAPDDDKVKFIIKSHPQLLKVEFKEVVLKSRTVTNVTPLQLVHGAKDGAMCETLAPFFEELYGSKEAARNEMQKQISEMKNNHKPFDFRLIIQVISTELFNLGKNAATGKWILNPATLAAIKTFREDFAACQP